MSVSCSWVFKMRLDPHMKSHGGNDITRQNKWSKKSERKRERMQMNIALVVHREYTNEAARFSDSPPEGRTTEEIKKQLGSLQLPVRLHGSF